MAGLRVGASGRSPARVLQHFDHILRDKAEVWPAVRPDVILQLGGRITSKSTSQFLDWAAQPSESRWSALLLSFSHLFASLATTVLLNL